ncbi:hypothetical protein CEXT_230671 [Caerostris extrusa]|nr:hypothetical protein CEXT_230671 [Caerostris extrusa]
MSIRFAVICSLLVGVPFAASQSETGSNGSKPWFWNSTTSATDSQTADELSHKSTTSTTPSTTSPEVSTTESSPKNGSDTQIFSPGVLDSDAFLPANITDGRSSFLELFSDDFAPANITRGRSSKAMNLDLLGNIREGRILNDDPGNRKLSLQGFIPIVSFAGKDGDDDDDGAKSSSKKRVQEEDLYFNGPYPPIPIDDEEKTKAENYYSPSTESQKINRQGYQKKPSILRSNSLVLNSMT